MSSLSGLGEKTRLGPWIAKITECNFEKHKIMTRIWTAKDAISIVLDGTTRKFKPAFYQNSTEKWFSWAICAGLIGAAATGIFSWIWKSENAAFIAVMFFYFSILIILLYQFLQLVIEMQKLRNPEKELMQPLVNAFNYSMDLIHELSDFELHHLSYAKSTFEQGAKHLRERISVLIGALDKVGVIPLAVTAYLSYEKVASAGFRFGLYECFGLAFIILYVFSIRMLRTAQWMEAAAELYTHAIEVKKLRGNQRK